MYYSREFVINFETYGILYNIISREIIITPPLFCLIFIQPPQNSNMFSVPPFFLNLYQLATFTLTSLNNLNEMIILPLNKLKYHFIS